MCIFPVMTSHNLIHKLWLCDSYRLDDFVQVVASISKVFSKDTEAPPGGVDDMTKLSYLHEPGVLQNLSIRYELNEIYVSFFDFTYSSVIKMPKQVVNKIKGWELNPSDRSNTSTNFCRHTLEIS